MLGHDKLFKILRKLAKQDKWYIVYMQSKELGNLRLFANDTDFTFMQLLFLNYLSFYSSLFFDISMGDVSQIVLENDIYEDSYNLYRNEKRLKQNDKAETKAPKEAPKNNFEEQVLAKRTEWLLRRPKK